MRSFMVTRAPRRSPSSRDFCHALLGSVLALLMVGVPEASEAQRAGRRAATLELLETHDSFYHGEEVIVHANAVGEGVLTYLVDDTRRMLVLDVPPPPEETRERFEIIGAFYDVGRLEPNDPRISGLPVSRLSQTLFSQSWPAVGQLPLIVATSATVTDPPDTATLRTVVLDPVAHQGQGVTLTGRFRGRNLYGDLPDSPGESRYDFVLTSADAAVWVVGKEPKGDDFDLDVQARRDTGRWLEVTGAVRLNRGMVIIEAGRIALAEPVPGRRVAPRQTRRQGPTPEVIFSTPFDDDTDIPTDTSVRIQFSRDMNPASFEQRVRMSYPTTGPEPGPIAFEILYRGRNRVLELRLVEALRPFSAVTVELLDGITATDGASLPPWSLAFYSGR